MSEQLAHLLEGYSQFVEFDARELVLVERLRTLRMIHYSAWLARRWSDPAFPARFPGSSSRAIGRTRCWRCASSWRDCGRAAGAVGELQANACSA